jgi:hypothetical protein
MLDIVASLAAQGRSGLGITGGRSPGTSQDLTRTVTLTPIQRDAVANSPGTNPFKPVGPTREQDVAADLERLILDERSPQP